MGKNRLLVVLFTQAVMLLWFTSCTFDYFEDETTYQVFVPEVLDNAVSDCRVLVYDKAGTLVDTRHGIGPHWGGDPRMAAGLFTFQLVPGEYDVYCYTNTDSLSFVDNRRMETSAFVLNNHPAEDGFYVHPSELMFQKRSPVLPHPGILLTDTARLEHYTGRVTVRFKNLPADVRRIAHVRLQAEGVGVAQYLRLHDVGTSRFTDNDRIHHYGELPEQTRGDILEVDHGYLPSIEGVPMRLHFTFLAGNGETLVQVPVDVKDRDTGLPLRLLSGERIIIEIDAYTIIRISIVGWDEDIKSGNTDMG